MSGLSFECIILAGGLGTRLRDSIGARPKCMAPVAGRPFLHYLFQFLRTQNVKRIVLSLGYESGQVIEWLQQTKWPFEIDWVIEETPLGTGGGIQLALNKCRTSNICVLNGDTFFEVSIEKLFEKQRSTGAETLLATRQMEDADRYGIVEMNEDGLITRFLEKQPGSRGAINGGVYFINRDRFLKRNFPVSFSFEKEYLERFVSEKIFYGSCADGYFIDIGIPSDYERAQTSFKTLFPE